MLRIAEEIILLLLDDKDGRFINVPTWSIDYAIAGSILMDLAMENRIDTDLENLILIDANPLNDSLLDPTLVEIEAGDKNTTRYWVEHVAQNAVAIREEALTRLVDAGHPGTHGRPAPLGIQFQALPDDRWKGRTRG